MFVTVTGSAGRVGRAAYVRFVSTEDEAAVRTLVGTDALLRARGHVARGEVADLQWKPETGRAQGRLDGLASGTVSAAPGFDGVGQTGGCRRYVFCRDSSCSHPVALALLVLAVARQLGVAGPSAAAQTPDHARTGTAATDARTGAERSEPVDQRQRKRSAGKRNPPVARRPAWESAVATLTAAAAPRRQPEDRAAQAEVALQFDLVPVATTNATATRTPTTAAGAAAWRVAMRPVVPGRAGWVRSGITWSSLDHYGYRRGAGTTRSHLRLLREILLLSSMGEDRQHYGYQQNVVHLDTFVSRRIWDLLAEAQDVGLTD